MDFYYTMVLYPLYMCCHVLYTVSRRVVPRRWTVVRSVHGIAECNRLVKKISAMSKITRICNSSSTVGTTCCCLQQSCPLQHNIIVERGAMRTEGTHRALTLTLCF